MDLEKIAHDLDGYMRFRAKREKVAYSLSPGFMLAGLERGIFSFFGVEVGPGGLLRDVQQPEMFKQWKARQRIALQSR